MNTYSDPIIEHYYQVSRVYGDPAEFMAAYPPPSGFICAHDWLWGYSFTTRRCRSCGEFRRDAARNSTKASET